MDDFYQLGWNLGKALYELGQQSAPPGFARKRSSSKKGAAKPTGRSYTRGSGKKKPPGKAGKSSDIKTKKSCSKGTACGRTCIATTKTCGSTTLKNTVRAAAEYLKRGTTTSGKKLSKADQRRIAEVATDAQMKLTDRDILKAEQRQRDREDQYERELAESPTTTQPAPPPKAKPKEEQAPETLSEADAIAARSKRQSTQDDSLTQFVADANRQRKRAFDMARASVSASDLGRAKVDLQNIAEARELVDGTARGEYPMLNRIRSMSDYLFLRNAVDQDEYPFPSASFDDIGRMADKARNKDDRRRLTQMAEELARFVNEEADNGKPVGEAITELRQITDSGVIQAMSQNLKARGLTPTAVDGVNRYNRIARDMDIQPGAEFEAAKQQLQKVRGQAVLSPSEQKLLEKFQERIADHSARVARVERERGGQKIDTSKTQSGRPIPERVQSDRDQKDKKRAASEPGIQDLHNSMRDSNEILSYPKQVITKEGKQFVTDDGERFARQKDAIAYVDEREREKKRVLRRQIFDAYSRAIQEGQVTTVGGGGYWTPRSGRTASYRQNVRLPDGSIEEWKERLPGVEFDIDGKALPDFWVRGAGEDHNIAPPRF